MALLTACDPSKDEISNPGAGITSEELGAGFTATQYSDDTYATEQADGNYFKYSTNPVRVVEIYQLNEDSSKNVLSKGASSGTFKLAPKRGGSPDQTYYIRTKGFDGSDVIAEKKVTVFVPTDLEPAVRIIASDAYGYKIWKWDTSWRADGGAWGSMGYAPGDGESFVNGGNGIWWACAPADLTGQMKHSDTGNATGEEDPNAYMEIHDDGTIITRDANGAQIRKGKYSITDYKNGERNVPSVDGSQANWAVGNLHTDAGTILWPFKINGGGEKPTDFAIMQLTPNKLKLIYAAPGTGSWKEATWWAFTSESDAEGALTDFGEKSWTWDVDWRADGGAWGDMGYAPGDGQSFVDTYNGIWWGSTPAGLTEQLKHSDTHVATGEEDPGAYMTFNWKKGIVTCYDAAGKEIRHGAWSIAAWDMGKRSFASADGSQASWSLGTLHTDAGSILFPFQINAGGVKLSDFEIMQLDGDHLKLIYPYKSDGSVGSWNEATWWAFKKKK